MKKLLLSLALLLSVSVMSSQTSVLPVATLAHGGIFTVYEGADALINAYNAAEEGDVITLSSGRFTSVDITRNITIRGAGMRQDTINNIYPTEIIGDFSIRVYENNGNNLIVEGLYIRNIIWCESSTGMSFLKCRINQIRSDYMYDILRDIKYTQCYIDYISTLGDATLVNCFVGDPNTFGNSSSHRMKYRFINCTIVRWTDHDLHYSYFSNCVIKQPFQLDVSNTVSSCIGVYTNVTDSIGNMFSQHPEHYGNVCFRDANSVFAGENYILQDSIKTKYLGSDGTEVGMYGGYCPFNHVTTAPQIRKFVVDRKSTVDGKLNVEIEVVDGADRVE